MLHGAPTLLLRALREDANRRRPHSFRLGGTVLIFLFLIVAHVSSGGIGAPGRQFFMLISFLNLALIVLAGSSYFATAITEEKEQGTLGLLHLAGVSPIGLLLGKSTSRLISVLLVFLGQLPFALLAITLGGITVRQIIAVDVALGAFLVMVANLGLLCSVIAKRSGPACAWMLLGLTTLLLGVHYGDNSLTLLVRRRFLSSDSRFISMSRDILSKLEEVSIVTRILEVLETGFDGSLAGEQVWWHLSVGVGAFLLSWLSFDRFTRYADVSAPSRGWLPQRKSRWKLLVGRPGKWPFVWKDYHFITGGHSLALLKLAVYPALLVLMWWSQDALQVTTGLPFPTLSRLVILILIAGELTFSSSRIFHEELKWGTLPSVASLPQPVIVIAYSKLLGCLLGIIPAVMVLCVLVMVVPPLSVQWSFWDEPGWWLLVMEFLVLLHLTALLSLIVKWGALASAVATLLVVNALLALPFSLVAASMVATFEDESSLIPSIIYLGLAMCAVLQVLIAISLRRAAAR